MKRLTVILAMTVLLEAMIHASPLFANELFFFRGARPVGMGGAFIAVADDENAIFYNPAGLGMIQKKNIRIGTVYQNFCWSQKIPILIGWHIMEANFSEMGINIRYIISPFEIAYLWEERVIDVNLKDITDNKILGEGKGLCNENAFTLGYGKELTKSIYIGICATYAHFEEDIESYMYEYVHGTPYKQRFETFDKKDIISISNIGFLYKLGQKVTLALTAHNIFSTKSTYPVLDDVYWIFSEKDERLLTNINLGFSYRLKNILVVADARNIFSEEIDVGSSYQHKTGFHLGSEICLKKNLALRCGYAVKKISFYVTNSQYYTKHTFSVGIGYKKKHIGFDTAITFDYRRNQMEKRVPEYFPTIEDVIYVVLIGAKYIF